MKTDDQIREEALKIRKFVNDWLFDSENFGQNRSSKDQAWSKEQVSDTAKMIFSYLESAQSSMEAEIDRRANEKVEEWKKTISNKIMELREVHIINMHAQKDLFDLLK
jgi:hypothetical protein